MQSRLLREVLALSLLVTGLVASDVTSRQSATYRAGIVEFKPPSPAATKQETVLNNAKLYGEYAARAAGMGVQILVFPEYGLVTLNGLGDRKSVAGYLQDVPDPKLQQWNPCEDPDKFKNTKVLHELSCAAKNNSIVIVANLLSREPCEPDNNIPVATAATRCPPDGHYQFNTNVIFAQNGTLLARYHKRHLFEEESYADPAPEPEYVIVDLGFVRIGTFVCFDIMFEHPAVTLVEKYGIRNIAFPTAWVNELPYMTAPQTYSAIAYGLGINILAANYFRPETGAVGSGIFSSTQGALNGTWDISTPGRLIIADVPVDPTNLTTDDQSLTCDSEINLHDNLNVQALKDPSYIITDKPSSKPTNKTHRIIYQPLSNFSSEVMIGMQGSITNLCQGSLCCDLSFKFATRSVKDTYKLVVNSGITVTPGNYKFGTQTCSVLRCEDDIDIETCGRVPDPSHSPSATFDALLLTGKFQTTHLYPSIFTTNLGLVATNKWNFSKRQCREGGDNGLNSYTVGKLNITSPLKRPILEASIVARVYNWDN